MELNRVSQKPCNENIIAIAIPGDNSLQHCGIAYTDPTQTIMLCDFLISGHIRKITLPGEYFWTPVHLEEFEAVAVMSFVELIIRNNISTGLYSLVYPKNGFNITGMFRAGAGFTCATFVSKVFDDLKLPIINVQTWRLRPTQDAKFKTQLIAIARQNGLPVVAASLQTEPAHFRVKPWEIFGSATRKKYPVNFCRAKKLARILSKLLRN